MTAETTSTTLPIPYADLVAPLTWDDCKAITDDYQAACRARFGDAWQPPSDETLTHWAFAEAAEAAIANVKANRTTLLRRDQAHWLKELADVMFVARQIGDKHLRGLALGTVLDTPMHSELSPIADAVMRATFRLVALDNLLRLETATIAPDGKVTKSPDYDTSQVYGWIEEVLRQTE